jgi:hypothetical protein
MKAFPYDEMTPLRAGIRSAVFVDQADTCRPETEFWEALNSGNAPQSLNSALHRGEGGSTTLVYDGANLVGLSVCQRDDFNRTLLLCVDLRPSGDKPGNRLDWSSDAPIDLLAKLEPGYYWLENVSKVDGIAVRRVIEVVRIEVGRVWGKHWVGPGTYLVTGDYLTGIGVLASWSGVRLEKVKSPEFASG